MTDPVRGMAEMARVTKPGGTVAACFWDPGRMPALGIFWAAAAYVDPAITGELRRPGAAPGELAGLLTRAGLLEIRQDVIAARAEYTGFEDWWSPYTLGVGPAGAYYRSRQAMPLLTGRGAAHPEDQFGPVMPPPAQRPRRAVARARAARLGPPHLTSDCSGIQIPSSPDPAPSPLRRPARIPKGHHPHE